MNVETAAPFGYDLIRIRVRADEYGLATTRAVPAGCRAGPRRQYTYTLERSA
jgi:hypothetical protein